jgi:hypothetical protein
MKEHDWWGFNNQFWGFQSRDSEYAFRDAGLIFLTDGIIFNHEIPSDILPAMILAMTQAQNNFQNENDDRAMTKRVRTYFPETWIWECVFMENENQSFEARYYTF